MVTYDFTKRTMFDERGRFVITEYQKKPPFSSFLPGICGEYGIPVWSFYVNRGQGIASFGVRDKNHSILEFYPAHQAYQNTKNKGFRTFLKVNGIYYEPFHLNDAGTKMFIGINELELEETIKALGIRVRILYYTLPGEPLGGLVREVRVENLTDEAKQIEMLDGLPEVIPYGIGLDDLKKMAQTMKAWMQVEDAEQKRPYYRVRYSTRDSVRVQKIEAGNFLLSFSAKGELLPVIADPELVFLADTSYEEPLGFLGNPAADLLGKKQNLQNQMPSGFACQTYELAAKESRLSYMLIGHARSKEVLDKFLAKRLDQSFFAQKREGASGLAEGLVKDIKTKTANPVFDAYCRQTYLDNILRGGYPVRIGENEVFYIYSRKHGDLERDYNDFTILPEYFSQGNGNFRDVNQNRRNDILFSPWIRDYNIKLFYQLIQLDGYNPLVLQQTTYQAKEPEQILLKVLPGKREAMREFLKRPFSPGGLFCYLEEQQIGLCCSGQEFLDLVTRNSCREINADFSEGYWTDHWTYNLDLVEAYLKIYPEDEERLLFLDQTYRYYESGVSVLPRSERYAQTEDGIRQYASLTKQKAKSGFACTKNGQGPVYQTNLMTKLTVIAANKFAALDMEGMGIEMEAGKPGWYDALNGLPGILGVSMAETYELQRLLLFMIKRLCRYQRELSVPLELYRLIKKLAEAVAAYEAGRGTNLDVWNRANQAKELYRSQTRQGVEGEECRLSYQEAAAIFTQWSTYLAKGIEKAQGALETIPPTYFSYEVEAVDIRGMDLIPRSKKVTELPPFLEGAVHYLKLLPSKDQCLALYERIKASDLYDRSLSMYKVNASLREVSFEAGRARAFSPGWLENESVWLHMEYKYLLEVLKAGLYREFFADFKAAGIPFQDYQSYGRSPTENSSFIVSSANENTGLWGRGFVARLSGATAEFLELYHVMMFGSRPFYLEEGELRCRLLPALPEYLIPQDGRIEAVFLGSTRVVYDFGQKHDIIPGNYRIDGLWIDYKNGGKEAVGGGVLGADAALRLRAGEVRQLSIRIS